jgi:SNF2 family DNA or RNA helicase
MAILHGSWIPQSHDPEAAGYFFVWGETWRRIDPIEIPAESLSVAHPFAMAEEELRELLRSLHAAKSLTWEVAEFPLQELVAVGQAGTRKRKATAPTVSVGAAVGAAGRWQRLGFTVPTQRFENAALPQHSASGGEEAHPALELFSWQVQGIRLTAIEALQFLQSLPLSSVLDDENFWLGNDLRFWSHIARWQLDLSARAKFLPILENGLVRWQVLLDSAVDQAHFDRFCRQIPGACRAYWSGSTDRDQESDAPIARSQGLIFDFLNSTIAAQIRAIATQTPVPIAVPKDLPVHEWLQALGQNSTVERSDPRSISEAARLESALAQWIAPLQQHLTPQLAAFRTCFYLNPPAPGQSEWLLEYFLQAIDDPEFLVGARTVWNNPVDQLKYMGRTIEQPQESLLAGLGLASRLYPLLEPSLQVQQPQACRLTAMQVYEFLKSMASLSNQQGWANRLGLRVQAETPTLKKNQRLGLQTLLNFKWELTIGGQRLSKAEFDRLVDLNSPLVEINGEWVELRQQDVKAAQTFFESRKDQMALSLEDALRISTGDTQMVEKLPVVGFEANGALQELINALTSGNQNVEAIAIPDTFQGELRPYQVRGASWLAFLERWGLGACLADDMGLGKTIQFITLMLHLKDQEVLEHPTLLVCPTSVLGNWERELKKFAPSLKAVLHHGDRRPQGKAFAKAVKGQDLVITSYSLVHRDTKDLQTVTWQGIVLDEAQNIKNSEAKQSQAVRQLETQFRIALTGTPVENRLSELWSILDFLNPGYLGPRNFFQRRFAIPIERYGDTASLQTLRGLVQPFILRRLKTDRSIIQDLPDKQEMTVFCGLTAEQAALYQKLVDQSLVDIESAEGIQRHGLILALLVRLKQVCNHPGLLKKGEPIDADLQVHSGKLQRLEEMLEEVLAEGDRCLIFTQFAEWGKLLQAHLHQRFNREVLYLYGSTSKKQREEMVDRFQNDPQAPRIFILSLKAGGVGLNLTRANHVFHFDRWWNPAVENQATDRVFRIGQTRNVQVHKFVCTGTLEERIHELIESKKALSEQVVGAGESWLTELGTDQLRNLLLLDRTAIIDD